MLSSIKTKNTTLQGEPSVSNVDAAIQTDDYELVRTFPKKPLQKENNNLVPGSSIIAKLENNKSIPADWLSMLIRDERLLKKSKF